MSRPTGHAHTRHLAIAAALLATALGSPQAGAQTQEEREAANLEKALYCLDLLENRLDLDTATEACFADTYIQHSPYVPDGLDGVLTHFANRIERYPDSSIEIARAAADGDLVWIHLRSRRSPDERGYAVINIFRMEDGKFVEHWGVGQPVPEDSLHGNSMF